ncbi:uncharacterized protein LOC116769831 [Danaus plexippus]|uniref:uncharacterized protein LOC116769831 n=1 Tax=Danaus plexippus TaxID=13037 RepID=UPI002AB2F3F0|nr:uncharacterized protein LOC116769831 [Danaus plexippus]
MLLNWVRILICVCVFSFTQFCDGQFLNFRSFDIPTSTPLPFPACRADNIECLRRGLRTFFFLMDSEYLGMKTVDPIILNSLTVALPEEQLSFLMRRINVTGARWTKLLERKFNLAGGKNGVRFLSDLHVTGELTMTTTARLEPFLALITMDIQGVESNVTYSWAGERGVDNEDYILIGPERIAVRNSRTPTFYLQNGHKESVSMMERVLQVKTSVLDHIANEITISLMHSIMDNFRVFANKVPAKHYYTYASVEDN